MKKDRKKIFKNLFIFLLIIVLTFYIIFKEQDFSQLKDILLNVDIKYFILAIVSMIGYFICDAINIGRTLKKLGEKSTLVKNIKYSLIGFFFSSVTPAASGGQPMQIYYMKKEKISVANSTLTFLVNLTCMQIVTISLALINLVFNIKNMNGVLISCFIVGILLNLSALALLIISIYSKRATNWLIKVSVKILNFIRFKNAEKIKEKLENELKKYQASAVYIKSSKRVIVKNLLTTYVQFLLYYSVTYWIYRSFGLNQYNILQIVSLQSILFATVSGIPSPGAVGVSEGGFLELFKNVYTKEQIGGAMLLNRGVNFYLFVIISSIIVLVYSVRDNKELKQLGPKSEEHEINEDNGNNENNDIDDIYKIDFKDIEK